MSDDRATVLRKAELYLRHAGPGFTIVQVNQPRTEDEVVAELKSRFPEGEIAEIDFRDMPPESDHPRWTQEQATAHPNARVLFLRKLHTLAGSNEEERVQFVHDLNFARELYAGIGKLLVFFLPAYFMDLIERHARDFRSFVLVWFEIPEELPQRLELKQDEAQLGDVTFLRNRVAFLESLLDDPMSSEQERMLNSIELGHCLYSLAHFNKAKSCFREAIRLSDLLNDTTHRSSALVGISRTEVVHGEYDKALLHLEGAKKISEAQNNTHNLAVTLGEIADIKLFTGEHNEALNLYSTQRSIYEKNQETKELANTLGKIARLMTLRGKIDDALTLHEEQIELYKKTGALAERTAALGDIARLKTTKGEIDTALELHEEQLDFYRRTKSTRGQAIALGDIARLLALKGQLTEAATLLENRLNTTKRLGDVVGIASTLWDLAMIELAMRKVEALGHLQKSYALFSRLGHVDGLATVGSVLGPLLCSLGQSDKALTVLSRSRDGFRKLGNEVEAKKMEEAIAECEAKARQAETAPQSA